MRCPVCSAEVDLKSEIFCNNCGTNMKPYIMPSVNKTVAQSKPEAPEKEKNNTVLIVCICALIGAMIICATAVGISVISNKGPEQNTTVTEEETYEDEYLFPTHNTYLTYEILSEYTSAEIDLICNEMYARHGQIFKKKKNIDYFSSKTWYEPRYTSMEYVITLFNEFEKKNLDTIASYRKNKGWEYELDKAL